MYLRAVDLPDLPNPLYGGLVPHAGWRYSGPCAAWTFAALKRNSPPPEVVVMLGAVHSVRVSRPTVCDYTCWRTPVGDLYVDRAVKKALIGTGMVEVNSEAHAFEHSIEVQVPMLRYLLPDAQFVPIAVPPDGTSLAFGDALAHVLGNDERRVAVVASSDLTHYGDAYGYSPAGKGDDGMAWARANDETLLESVEEMDPEGVLEHAMRKRSACGSGALAAAMTTCAKLGAKQGQVLLRTSSNEELPAGETDLWVGYASAVFRR